MIRRTALAILLGGLTTAFAADEALPKAETILDRYVEVTGGNNTVQLVTLRDQSYYDILRAKLKWGER